MNKKRCLLVLDRYSGLDKYILEGNDISGMPALFYLIESLKENYILDIIYPSDQLKSKFVKRNNINIYFISENRIFQFVEVFKLLNFLFKRNKYSFCYVTGYLNIPVSWKEKELKQLGIKKISRFFGTFLYDFLIRKKKHKNKILDSLKRYLEIYSIKTKSDLVIMTNDGTQGDKVLERLGIRNYLFLLNGINRQLTKEINLNDKLYWKKKLGLKKEVFYITNVSRLAKWKRVDLVIDFFYHLVNTFKMTNAKLIIIGNGKEYNALKEKVKMLKLIDKVEFLGSLPNKLVLKYMKASDLLTSFYDVSNVGNVLLEGLSLGKCFIVRNTGGTSSVIKNGYNGILIDESLKGLEIAREVSKVLLRDKKIIYEIEKNAYEFALQNILDWKDRISLEIDYIESI